jgi:hypothetical protein
MSWVEPGDRIEFALPPPVGPEGGESTWTEKAVLGLIGQTTRVRPGSRRARIVGARLGEDGVAHITMELLR